MSTEDAKAYLSKREVPRLFECLMTGLMFHRPNDHIQYLVDSLEKVKAKGQAELTWNMFVEVRSSKTPLPPITSDNDKRPISRGRITPKEEARPLTPAAKPSPLPPIGSSGIPNVPIIFIMGGPGVGKATQATKLAEKHPGWVNIHLGELLRAEMLSKGAEEKWRIVKDLVVNGELAPEDVTIDLLYNHIKGNAEANGFIIQGFPRDIEQAQGFEKVVGRIDAVFLLDCEEEKLTNNVLTRGQATGRLDDSPSALARRMATFREKTLPVLKQYDDHGKLYIVDGEQDEETMHDELSIIFETLLQNLENGRIPTPPAEGRPLTGRRSRKSGSRPGSRPRLSPTAPPEPDDVFQMPEVTYIPPPELKVQDEGRKPELPQAPIIFLAGGPGSGKGTQCKYITDRYTDIVHLSMGEILRKEITEKGSADEKWTMIMKLVKEGEMAPVDVTEQLLIKSMQNHSSAKAFLVEGYPRDILQYEDFNRNIGGQSFTILLDCDDRYLQERLVLRGASGVERIDDNTPAIEKKLAFFARNTLPLLKVIDDENKMIVIDGDRDEQEILFDIVKCIDFSLYGLELQENPTSAKLDNDDDDYKTAVGETMKSEEAPETSAAAKKEGEETGSGQGGPVEIVEETTMVQSAPVPTGALISNPSYTSELDALAPGDATSTSAEVTIMDSGETTLDGEETVKTDQSEKLDETNTEVVENKNDSDVEDQKSRSEDSNGHPTDKQGAEPDLVEDSANQDVGYQASTNQDAEHQAKEEESANQNPESEAPKEEPMADQVAGNEKEKEETTVEEKGVDNLEKQNEGLVTEEDQTDDTVAAIQGSGSTEVTDGIQEPSAESQSAANTNEQTTEEEGSTAATAKDDAAPGNREETTMKSSKDNAAEESGKGAEQAAPESEAPSAAQEDKNEVGAVETEEGHKEADPS